MNYTERENILKSTDFVGRVQIAGCDWAQYWAINGTASIEDPDLRQKTDDFIALFLSNPDAYTGKIATLAISDDGIKAAQNITDALISTAVTRIMANALDYLM